MFIISRKPSIKTPILCALFLLITFLILGNSNSVYAETSIYRSAGSVGELGGYTTTGCQTSDDGLYCTHLPAPDFTNLFLNSFGNLESFGIPQYATITKLYMRIKDKNSIIDQRSLHFRIARADYEITTPWSSDIDNFEIAFDYTPSLSPTPTPNPYNASSDIIHSPIESYYVGRP